MEFRREQDTLGEVMVPIHAYYGAQTQRAGENFPISGLRLQPGFIRAQALIKLAAARANMATRTLDPEVGQALVAAAEEILAGKFDDQFIVDVFQAGAGTSQNMNINEVLANRAEELLGGQKGQYQRVHPNDHANMSQSTNDTMHVAIHIATACATADRLLPALDTLKEELTRKSQEFDGIIKCARTHLQDAVPIRLGQEFGAWATMLSLDRRRLEHAGDALLELCLGGTAVGTGLNTPRGYIQAALRQINSITGLQFRKADNLVAAMQSFNAVVHFAGALTILATSLKKIADDFRLLSSGPRCGLSELRLPAVQPGSSIMPGKVNPVMAEMLNMVCIQVMGCNAVIIAAAQAAQLDLNVMMPVIGYNVLLSVDILSTGMQAFATRCVAGVTADGERCRRNAESSHALATALSPIIGYHRAAALAQEALAKDVSIRELALAQQLGSAEEINRLLDLDQMTRHPDEEEKPE